MNDFLRDLIKDKAILSNRSMEDIVKGILEEIFLPSNSSMKDIIMLHLYEHDGVGHTVSAIFQATSGGIDWKAKNSNFLPLVEFCQEHQKHSVRLTDSEAGYLRSNLRLLLEHLPNKKALELNDIIVLLKDGASEFNTENLYQFLIRNWGELNSWSATYRALYALTSTTGTWTEDAETRCSLLKILKEISEEWESPDMQG